MNKMDEIEITTRRFFRKNTVQLLPNRIIVRKSSPFESSEFELSYEQIENKKTIERKVNFGLLALALFCVVIGLLYLFGNSPEFSMVFFFSSLLFLMIAFATKLELVVIKSYGGRNIELFFNRWNRDKVIAFGDRVIDAANNFLLKKYSRVDKDLPFEHQIQNLMLLRERELLTEEKFLELKNQLLGKDKSNIGYK